MKTILATVSAIGLLAAAPAYANDVSSTVNIGATVSPACGLGNHINNGNTTAGYTQGDIALGEVASAATDGKLVIDNSQTQNRSFGNVWCNGAATVTIKLEALALNDNRSLPAPGDSSSFANKFDIAISGFLGGNAFGNGGGTLALSSADGTNGVLEHDINTAEAFETGSGKYSSFNLTVLNPANKRPVVGSYTGHVTLTASIS
ncbi:hypothetical protein [Sphingopyxis sp.]|uniref:hypothetical protein n=1 Tax=Sphingopyxis sp. TaxID=1908224 RepID=UPI0026276579|nr:hypothetical protein [Sphingopyxis sp.]MCW0196761.1 hypothetical protein [Sphingopyxis sp.]